MIVLGAALAGVAVIGAVLATRRRTPVGSRLARVAPRVRTPRLARSLFITRELERSGLGWSETELLRAKSLCALAFAAVAAGVTVIAPLGPVAVAIAAYAGFILPTLRVDRAAARRRAEGERALVTFVEWMEALVASGRPVEPAVLAIAEKGVGGPLVDDAVAAAARSYSLGAPLFPALARESESRGLPGLAAIAGDLERARDLGRGAIVVLRDHRDRLRASERAKSLDAAGRVEGRLMLVLVLCYLPALMLLVVIPLFLGLLDGLFV
jgi:Flp pilus assembly protein TadB